MKFKTNIEIVTGFLGAGKSTFINALIEDTLEENERVVIIQCEQGETEIKDIIKKGSKLLIKKYDPLEPLNIGYLRDIITLHCPHRVIIEHNGSRNINELLELLNQREISSLGKVFSIYCAIDAITYEMFINNMGNLILDSIYNSNLIILNNTENIQSEKLNGFLKQLENFNLNAFIISIPNIMDLSAILRTKNFLYKGFMKKMSLFVKNQLLSYSEVVK